MKKQIWKVALWTILFSLFMGPVGDWVETLDFKSSLSSYYIPDYRMVITYNFHFINIICAVSMYLILYKFYPKRKIRTVVGLGVLLTIVVISYRYLVEEVIMFNLIGQGNYNPNATLRHYFIDNIYYVFLYGFIGLIYYFLQSSLHNEKLKNEYLLQKERSEHLFLKSQVNPHFLFNSLNNIYSLIYSKSDKALDSVSKLSSMLRYTLYENEEWIPLSKEVSYIKDFIALEQTRLPYDLACKIDIDEDLLIHEVTPYIMIPFVENAFKHGVLSDPAHPVVIDLKFVGDDLHFTVKNKYVEKQKDKVGGIGIENVKKRLAYVYGERHQLDIIKAKDTYKIHLVIKDL